MTIVLTGQFEQPRADIIKKLSIHNEIGSHVDRMTTDLVVYGSCPGSKLTKAKSIGITCVSEDELGPMITIGVSPKKQ